MMNKITAIVLLIIGVISVNTVAFATTSYPYRDVNPRTIDRASIKSISFLKKEGAFKGVFSKKFHPNKTMTRRQFLMIIDNLYPGKVSVRMADIRRANKPVTERYVTKKLVGVADKLDHPIEWDGGSKKLSRATVANYVVNFAKEMRRS